MHELGIIVHINKTLHQLAEENSLTEIGQVTLEVGEVSTIVPEYLTDCWAYYRQKFPLIEHAELNIEMLPAVTFCEDCGRPIRRCSTAGSARIAAAATHICSPGRNAISRKSKRDSEEFL